MAHRIAVGFLVLCISFAIKCEDVPLDKREKVLIPPADVIHVLAGTTAWFNWTHTIGGLVSITWGKDPNEALMSYGFGKLEHHVTERQRLGYFEADGSAKMFFNNVSASDEGVYEVRIAHQGAAGAIDSSTVRLRVIPPSEIGVRVTIDGIQADVTVNVDGTDVTLPDDRVMLTDDPSVKVESLYPVPWSGSTYHISTIMGDSVNMANRSVNKRSHGRDMSVLITIEVRFDVQNLGVIVIKKSLYPPAHWINTPGHIKVLDHTTAYFDWSHNIDMPDIEWNYEGTSRNPDATYIMGFSDNRLYIAMDGDLHSRLGSESFPGSAVLKLHNVHKRDEGWYSVNVKDGRTAYHISNAAELSVIDVSDLKFHVGYGSAMYELSVTQHGTEVHLPEVRGMPSSELKVYVQMADTAPKATVTVFVRQDNNDPHNTGIQCPETRYCDGYIPISDLERYHRTSIVITINFGVQNLGLISISSRIPQGAASVINSDANSISPNSMTWTVVFSLSAVLLAKYSEDIDAHDS